MRSIYCSSPNWSNFKPASRGGRLVPGDKVTCRQFLQPAAFRPLFGGHLLVERRPAAPGLSLLHTYTRSKHIPARSPSLPGLEHSRPEWETLNWDDFFVGGGGGGANCPKSRFFLCSAIGIMLNLHIVWRGPNHGFRAIWRAMAPSAPLDPPSFVPLTECRLGCPPKKHFLWFFGRLTFAPFHLGVRLCWRNFRRIRAHLGDASKFTFYHGRRHWRGQKGYFWSFFLGSKLQNFLLNAKLSPKLDAYASRIDLQPTFIKKRIFYDNS